MQWQSRQHTRAARCARGPFPSSVDRPETQTRCKSSRSGGWKRKIEIPTAGHSLSRKIYIPRQGRRENYSRHQRRAWFMDAATLIAAGPLTSLDVLRHISGT